MSQFQDPPSSPPGEENPEKVIPVIQEEVSVSREVQETGARVRVRIEAHQETEQVTATDFIDEVSVERVPVNRLVNRRADPREEGDTLVIPVYETVAVVEMRLLLKEEVRIVKRRREVVRQEEVVLNKESAVVERRAANQDDWRPDPGQSG